QPINDRVERKFVTPGVDTQFQCRRKAELPNGKSDNRQIFIKLFVKLREIAPVIDSLIETPGELRSDGLDRDPLHLNHRQNEQKLYRCLSGESFIYRDLSNKIVRAFLGNDSAVDASCFLHGQLKFASRCSQAGFINFEWTFDTGNRESL